MVQGKPATPALNSEPILFVTGATGFLGGHFLKLASAAQRGASARNLRLRCLVRKPVHHALPNVEWVRGDLLKSNPWRKKLKGCHAVIHLATCPLPECERDPILGSKVIVAGLSRLMEYSTEAGIQRFIIASTSEVYGSPDRLPIKESVHPRPLSIYGFLKACADFYAMERAMACGLSVCILRFFNLYGRAVDCAGPVTVLTLFAEQILHNRSVILHASRRNSRDFLHVKDAARALWAAVEKSGAEGLINIGSGRETTLQAAAQRLAAIAGKKLMIDFRPNEGRWRRMAADCSRARRLLGFRPKVSLDQGLCEVLEDAAR